MNRRILVVGVTALSLLTGACDGNDPAGVPAPPEVAFVEVVPGEEWLEVGDTVRLTAVARSAAGGLVTGLPVTWTAGDPARVSVVAAGSTALVTALQPGMSTVAARVGGKSNDATVHVELPAPGSIEIDPATALLDIGHEVIVHAVVRSPSGEVMNGQTVQWAVDDEDVAMITYMDEPGHVRVTARGEGTALVTAWVGAAVTTMAVKVLPASAPASSMEVSPETLTVETNRTVPLRAAVWGMDGGWIENPVVTWTTSDSTVATVAGRTDGGRADLTAKAPGVVVVRAFSGGRTDSTRITVVAPPAVGAVYVRAVPNAIWKGSYTGMETTVVGPSGPIPGAPVTWSVEDPTVAEVDAVGRVLGLAPGSTKVWAESGGVRGSATVRVHAWPGDGIVTFDLRVGVDPWGTPRLLSSMGATTWTDSLGVARPGSLWLAGGSLRFHGDGRFTRTLDVDVRALGLGGILATVERRTIVLGGRVLYDVMDAYAFHLMADGQGTTMKMESLQAGSWIIQEAFGEIPILPWRWDMR